MRKDPLTGKETKAPSWVSMKMLNIFGIIGRQDNAGGTRNLLHLRLEGIMLVYLVDKNGKAGS